jgi:hypothetical protein
MQTSAFLKQESGADGIPKARILLVAVGALNSQSCALINDFVRGRDAPKSIFRRVFYYSKVPSLVSF